MAQNRLILAKQLEQSLTPQSLVKTNSSNEQEYLAPGSAGAVLTIVGGIPTWQAPAASSFSLTDGTTTEIISSGDTLTITGGNGIVATVSATDTLTLLAKISTDANNSISFGSDGGLYFNEANNLTGVVWNDVTNNLEFTYDVNGTPTVVNVNIADTVSAWLADFTVTGDTGTDVINNHETLTIIGQPNTPINTTVTSNQVRIDYIFDTKEQFSNLTTGNTVTLSSTPNVIKGVYRNGVYQMEGASFDFTISGSVITFANAFGPSGNGAGVEQVEVIYGVY